MASAHSGALNSLMLSVATCEGRLRVAYSVWRPSSASGGGVTDDLVFCCAHPLARCGVAALSVRQTGKSPGVYVCGETQREIVRELGQRTSRARNGSLREEGQ